MFDFFIVINDLFNLKKRAVRTAGQCMFDDIIQLENNYDIKRSVRTDY